MSTATAATPLMYQHASAWTGPEMADRSEWGVELSAAELREFERCRHRPGVAPIAPLQPA